MSVAKDQAAASVALGSNVHPLVRTYSVTNLSQQHNDFEALMVELERDPESAAELADARAWVADTFYPGESDTLRTVRLRKGLSQMQLAERLQTSQPQVAKIESGKVDPQYSTLVKLGAALDLDPNALFRLFEAQAASKRNSDQ
ncbi:MULTISPECIES: helix-turn-helix domain-containing protein [Pseudomonas]|uniref:transcriptional repressor n=1 Tax=Pseudomonas phage MD8 TaxID=1868596 RepID=UPI0008042943|nr:helix-turn-helix transcriptional regulator [Pseudomonas aeruginosa]YP_009289279.1 transcriptional repressor [Pseudomonas phage MD8]HCL2778285.1 helix-turn-helix transcriptional regulator [Pseudomonas aeruginosa AC9A]ANO57353.1 HigA-like antitoxin [Pseudomonas phage MD8]EKI2989057.1 helix-turn-helix transcriptional regulator [Pseudomonas aeruginosa]EKV4542817.1 helix-turn-helix transcriptional regulator [Pseudomonas aeruginosa]EKV5567121.1 helix-turn-helix transcriptional regulator [Pseudom